MRGIRECRRRFAQWSDVIEDPEAAAVRGHDQIIVVNPEIAHRRVRQIQLQRLPAIAVIERYPDRILRPGEQ